MDCAVHIEMQVKWDFAFLEKLLEFGNENWIVNGPLQSETKALVILDWNAAIVKRKSSQG